MTNEAKHMVVVVAVDDDFRVRESIESLVEAAGYAPQLFSTAEDSSGSPCRKPPRNHPQND
jgi:FixJ family two-component response regulator